MADSKDSVVEEFQGLVLREIDKLKPSQREEVYRIKSKLKEQCDEASSRRPARYAVMLLIAELRKEVKD